MNATRFLTLLRHDVRLQFRNGIYFAYGFVILTYAGILFWLAPYLPDWMPGLVILTDPAVVGFFFLGALMMLEKAEDVRTGLAVTPISAADYFWAKTLPLTIMAVIAVAVIGLFLHAETNHLMLAATVVLTSVCFLGVGVPTALHFKTVTSYLVGSAAYMVPIMAPILLAFGDQMPGWATLIPTASQMRLVLVATSARDGSAAELTWMFAVAAGAAAAAVWFATRQLEKELGHK